MNALFLIPLFFLLVAVVAAFLAYRHAPEIGAEEGKLKAELDSAKTSVADLKEGVAKAEAKLQP